MPVTRAVCRTTRGQYTTEGTMPGVNRIDRERVMQLLRQGSTPKQVCLRLGINKDSVLRIAREAREGKA